MTLYADTSACIPLFKKDVLSADAEALALRTGRWTISNLTSVEFASRFAIDVRVREVTPDRASGVFAAFDRWQADEIDSVLVEADDLTWAERLIRGLTIAVKGPDAIHLAVTARLKARLITFDKGMAKAAEALGIEVVR